MPVNPPGASELRHYDLDPPVTTFTLPAAGTNNTTLGVRTGAGRYVLKRYAVPHGAAGLVSLTEREIAALVGVTILRDTVSVIWHYGRSLAQGRPPERERLEEMRHSTTWLKAHRSAIEALPLARGDGRQE